MAENRDQRTGGAERPAGGDDADPGSPDAGGNEGDLAATYCATLVDEWVACGLRHAVISPGSRSTPLAVAVAGEPRLDVEVVHDERAAAYMAVGLGRAAGLPALALCTSGTAAVNFHPAVVEADLAGVPLIVATADRPPEMQDRLAPQTIHQRDLYGYVTRWYCEPGPPSEGGAPWWRDMARDAFRRSTGVLPGPVHLNLAFREPLVGTATTLTPRDPRSAGTLPSAAEARAGAPWGVTDEALAALTGVVSQRRGLLVCGERTAVDEQESAEVWRLADRLGWPVLADPLSGVRRDRPGSVSCSDSLLRHERFAGSVRPDVVLRFGGLAASRVLNDWLGSLDARQIAVDRFGRCPDPCGVLAGRFTASPAQLAAALLGVEPDPAPAVWRTRWSEADEAARGAVARALVGIGEASEPAVAIDLMAAAPAGSTVFVSSSMPVRDLEGFSAPRGDVRVLANRGANGIDGVTATATGVALAAGHPTLLLTGDLAFLHDSSALVSLVDRPVDLVLVVIDNRGGGIFGFLPQARALDGDTFEELFGTPHSSDLLALARAHGLPAERVESRAGFQAALAGALVRGGPRVIVVAGDRRRNVAVHSRLQGAVARALDRLHPQ